MVAVSKSAKLKYTLGGNPAKSPENIDDTEVIANFNEDSVQANITTDNWTFYGLDALSILAHKNAGNMYEGYPFKVEVFNNNSNLVGFNGLLDLTGMIDTFDIDSRVKCGIVKDEGLNTFFNQLKISFAYLESINVFTQSDYQDCKYVVQKKVNITEELIAGIVLYLMLQQFASQVRVIAATIAEITAHAVGGVSGSVAAIAFGIAKALIELAYAATIVVLIIDLSKKLFETFIPPIRTHKTLNYLTAMTKVCAYLGYGFNTSITELSDQYYLPSNPQLESPELSNFLTYNAGTQSGIPRSTDPHYICEDFFDYVKKEKNGKFAIVNGIVQFHSKGAPYWFKNSTYTIPSVKLKPKETNASELVGTRTISYQWDLNDEYTVDNFTGTTYEIQTNAVGINNIKANLISGTEIVDLNICLGTPKTELLPLEKQLKNIGKTIDKLVIKFGGNSSFESKVTNKIGMLKQSNNWHSKPKVLMLLGDKLHPQYRSTISAQASYQDHYAWDSFVLNNYGGQKEIYNGVKIPFGMVDFNSLINNSYCNDSQGREAKITSIKWKIKKDYAIVDYWVKEPFTNKLTETYIEP